LKQAFGPRSGEESTQYFQEKKGVGDFGLKRKRVCFVDKPKRKAN